MMLDVLGLNSVSAVWRRLLLDVSLFSLKIYGEWGLFSIQHRHLCHQLERTSLRQKPVEKKVEQGEK